MKDMLLMAPDSQLDASMFPLIQKWDEPDPTALQLLEVIDNCIHGALSSGTVLMILQGYLDQRLEAEGKTLEDILPDATWRNRSYVG
jgi:hypothetical protein